MVKALITFEGVGQILLPGFDVAEVSKRHVRRVFIQQFSQKNRMAIIIALVFGFKIVNARLLVVCFVCQLFDLGRMFNGIERV